VSATSKRLSPQDLLFLFGETPSSMMHVGALMPFTPPAGAPLDYLRQMFEDTRHLEVVAPWNRKLSHPRMLYRPDQSWVLDDAFDIDYHVRRSALASPGDERELGILVSRLHSHPIDFTRPPWELHFIEGLEGGRFAIYMKVHHSLVDGYTGSKMLERSLSTDPSRRDQPLFFHVPSPSRPRTNDAGPSRNPVMSLLGSTVGGAQSVLNIGKAFYNTQFRGDAEYGDIVNSLQAPHSILNKHISRNRRFATQVYPFERLKAIGAKHGATVNDVALAIIGGGLRSFLAELGELPEKPLIAFLPVNVRPKDDVGGGNSVGTILATMGTDIDDPVQRLAAITSSTKAAKSQLQGMSQTEILGYTAALMAPTALQLASAMTGLTGPLPFTFNLCVSNVPGPRKTLYLNGSRLEATYPVSIPMHGMALNITLESYADVLNFGFVGCRDALPHLQRLAVYTGDALDELEKLA
jgi:WS/DGAT/MGAT family acyltransferase